MKIESRTLNFLKESIDIQIRSLSGDIKWLDTVETQFIECENEEFIDKDILKTFWTERLLGLQGVLGYLENKEEITIE